MFSTAKILVKPPVNVFAQKVDRMLGEELEHGRYVPVYTDASSRFFIYIKWFSWWNPVKTIFGQFILFSGEKKMGALDEKRAEPL